MTIDPVFLGILMPIFLVLWFVSMAVVWTFTPMHTSFTSPNVVTPDEGQVTSLAEVRSRATTDKREPERAAA